MKGFLTTHKGMEDIAAMEVKELIGSESLIDEACIVFGIKNYEELFKLCYKSQSAIGIYYLLSEFDYKDIFDDFENNIGKIKFDEWLGKNVQFRVKCTRNYEDDAASVETESKLGEIIIGHMQKKYSYKQKVDLEKPEIIVFFFLTKKRCFVSIDFAGFDLSKRSYKIFQHPADIKGTIAYSLIRIAGYGKNETMLDIFSGSGTIPIEAALFSSNFPVRHFDREKFIFLKFKKFKDFDFNKLFRKLDREASDNKPRIYNVDLSMKNINYAKKNSKIAGVDKKISFSRMDAEWLDTKFDKGKVDKIVAKMPNSKGNELYNEFFYQAEFILSDKGKIVLMGNGELTEKYSSKHKFEISGKREIFSGKMKYNVFMLTKKEKK
ncbi:MAG: THUMP domain-containing protein [Nanoarchaeota archaeon]